MKAECPACKAYLSGVWEALEGERSACPSCGLDAEAMRQVMKARKSLAEKELTERCEQALIRAAKAEADLARLRAQVYRARDLFGRWAERDPLTSDEWRQAGEDAYQEELSW
jgi:hypothetical protein